jgi:predicted PhzF superfamily epimerase YddE/YHI9
LAFGAPTLLRGGDVEADDIADVARQLRVPRDSIIDAQWVDNGPGWLAVMLANAEAVLTVEPAVVDRAIGIVGMYPPGSPHAYEVRSFFPMGGRMVEDPVTGSLHAGVAQWLIRKGIVTAPYTASQGAMMRRAGIVKISVSGEGRVCVGGHVATAITGTVEI